MSSPIKIAFEAKTIFIDISIIALIIALAPARQLTGLGSHKIGD
jgi:hypothetical protein